MLLIQPHLASATACATQFGAVCWRNHGRKVEVLLITSRDTGRWVIPKGWAIDGLDGAQTAAREAWEEAGVDGKVDPAAIGLFHYDKLILSSPAVPCKVEVYGLQVTSLAKRFPERHQRRRKWFAAEVAAHRVNEPELGRLLESLQSSSAITP